MLLVVWKVVDPNCRCSYSLPDLELGAGNAKAADERRFGGSPTPEEI